MNIDWTFIAGQMPTLLAAMGVTIKLVLLSSVLGVIIGLLVCFGKMYGVGAINTVCRTYVVVVRAIPELVIMFWVYYCGPLVLDMRLSGFTSASAAMALYSGAMLAEVFRAGILAVPRGQHQAARALGLPLFWIWWSVIGPQAFRRAIPALLGIIALQIKISGIASAIGVGELVYTANIIGGQTYRYFDLFTAIGAMYFILIFVISLGARAYEKKLRRQDA